MYIHIYTCMYRFHSDSGENHPLFISGSQGPEHGTAASGNNWRCSVGSPDGLEDQNLSQNSPLVMTNIAMENHHLRWVNPIFYSYVKLPEGHEPIN